MTCNEVRDLSQKYLDGELDSSVSCCLAKHVDSCPACCAYLKEQRSCHVALERASTECLRSTIPSDLSRRAFARLDCPACSCSQLSKIWMRAGAIAAMLLLTVGGYAAWCQLFGNCRWVVAASEAHDRIVSEKAPVLSASADLDQVRAVLATYSAAAKVPCLERCQLKPHHCGNVEVAGCAGVYVCYQNATASTATLLVLPTDATPKGEAVRDSLIASKYTDHTLLSWRSADQKHLYILITKHAMDQTLPLAEAAREQMVAGGR